MKYNGTTGTQTWAVAYDGTASGQDIGLKVAVDSSNNVFVTGRSRGDNGNPTGDDIVTIKYNPTTGAQNGIDRYTTSGSPDDFPAALAVDSSNNVIVAGTANTGSGVFRLFVRKLNNTLTTAAWAGGGVTIDTGGDIGAAAMALDSSNNVVVTGQYRTNTSKHGFYTAKLLSSDGTFDWETNNIPVSDDLIGAPTSVTIGPDDNPIVTGFLKNASGAVVIRTIKYTSGGFFGGAVSVWDKSDTGLGFGDSSAHQVVSDGGSNAVIIGESDNADNDADIYMAKYDALTGDRLEFDTFAGTFGSDDTGVGAVVDGNGGVAVTGIAIGNVNNIGYQKFATIKYNRFIAYSGDALPDDTGVPVNALYAAGNSPAISDTSVAAKITAASGKIKLAAILTQGIDGGTSIPAVQKGTAPGILNAKFASISDPIISPDGHYAFAAKVSGVPASKASGVWTNLGGTLHLALQKGTPVPGMTENLSTVISLSMDNSALVALVKVAAPATSNLALVSINSANSGTVLWRTGQSITVAGTPSTIKTLTVLSPAKASPGDGRWHHGNTTVKATLADKRTVILHPNSGMLPLVSGGVNFNAKTFGLPALSLSGTRFTTLLTQNVGGNVTTANDTTIIPYNANNTGFDQIATEGGNPITASLSSLTFASFSDPHVDSLNNVLFLATLKGNGVKPTNNKALLFGTSHTKIARTGDPATDSAGATGTAVWSSFISHALAGGQGRPVFVAKLAGSGVTAKNNMGIWATDSSGDVRRVLRTGDALGTNIVKSFILLKPVPTAFSAQRSFNNSGTVGALVTFTNKKQALFKIGLP